MKFFLTHRRCTHNSYTPHASSMCIVKFGLLGATSSCLWTKCSCVHNTEFQSVAQQSLTCFPIHCCQLQCNSILFQLLNISSSSPTLSLLTSSIWEGKESQNFLCVMNSSSYAAWKITRLILFKKCKYSFWHRIRILTSSPKILQEIIFQNSFHSCFHTALKVSK